jgi:hypothetical protein
MNSGHVMKLLSNASRLSTLTNHSMNKLLSTLAVVIATAAPAQANEAYRMLNSQALTRTVRATGTTVLYDQPRCYEYSTYGYYHPASDTMVLCVNNHYENGELDYRELGDTLRHESMHIAQACNGGNAILPWNTIAKYSNNRILSIVQSYPAEDQHIEYEAFTAATTMNNTQITKIVKDFCF